ncbi:MAG: hypothetical protein ACP5FH_11580, partial [Terracidiphilus sp.]
LQIERQTCKPLHLPWQNAMPDIHLVVFATQIVVYLLKGHDFTGVPIDRSSSMGWGFTGCGKTQNGGRCGF